MARSNPIDRNTERKIERTYGSGATKGRKGGASPAMANRLQDKRAGRKQTSSMLRYAGGESRAVYANGKRVKGGASAVQRTKDRMMQKAGSTVYNPASLFS